MKSVIQFCIAVILFVGACVEALSATPPPAKTPAAATPQLVCKRIYGDKIASCKSVPCEAQYQDFLGTWRGEFHAYDRARSTQGKAVYRPYHEQIAYTRADCLHNVKNGDVFIVGHQTDRYPAFGNEPAKLETSLLVIGRHADGKPFLRTVGVHGNYSYTLTYRNEPARLSIWTLHLPAADGNPKMTFTTVDGRDYGAAGRTRSVTVTLCIGPTTSPYWQGVIAYGSHMQQ